MRPIKFRAWDDKKKIMCWNIFLDSFALIKHYYTNEGKDLEFMQYTGLKDKRGREIYERDIVKTSDYGDITAPVVYDNGCFLLVHESLLDDNFSEAMPLMCFMELEVIGNIYENPELLERRKK